MRLVPGDCTETLSCVQGQCEPWAEFSFLLPGCSPNLLCRYCAGSELKDLPVCSCTSSTYNSDLLHAPVSWVPSGWPLGSRGKERGDGDDAYGWDARIIWLLSFSEYFLHPFLYDMHPTFTVRCEREIMHSHLSQTVHLHLSVTPTQPLQPPAVCAQARLGSWGTWENISLSHMGWGQERSRSICNPLSRGSVWGDPSQYTSHTWGWCPCEQRARRHKTTKRHCKTFLPRIFFIRECMFSVTLSYSFLFELQGLAP